MWQVQINKHKVTISKRLWWVLRLESYVLRLSCITAVTVCILQTIGFKLDVPLLALAVLAMWTLGSIVTLIIVLLPQLKILHKWATEKIKKLIHGRIKFK